MRPTLHCVALGAADGTTPICSQRGNAGNTVVAAVGDSMADEAAMVRADQIHVATLDSRLADGASPAPRVALLKMDVQGWVLAVQRLPAARAIKSIKFEVARWLHKQGCSAMQLTRLSDAASICGSNPPAPRWSGRRRRQQRPVARRSAARVRASGGLPTTRRHGAADPAIRTPSRRCRLRVPRRRRQASAAAARRWAGSRGARWVGVASGSGRVRMTFHRLMSGPASCCPIARMKFRTKGERIAAGLDFYIFSKL